MSSQHLCPFCASPLLCQIIDGNLSWYCRHCHLEIPYGICHEIGDHNHTPDIIAQVTDDSAWQLLGKTWKKTVTDIKEALNADRVMLWKYTKTGELKVLEEALNPDYPSMKDWMMGHFFTKQELNEFTQGKLQINSHIENLLESFFEVKAKLVAPIILPDDHHVMPKLWGLLLVNHCAKSHQWEDSEIKLLSIIAKQIGVNIEQVESFYKLKTDYQKLENSTCVEQLTGLKSACQLEGYLQQKWQEMTQLKQPLSIIIGKIDGWEKYQHIWGEQDEKICFKQIARVITSTCQEQPNLIVKNEAEEFIIILPSLDGVKAVKLAEKMRQQVQALQIKLGQKEYLTISLGIASTIPQSDTQADTLLQDAQNALNNRQKQSKNSLIFSEYNNREKLIIEPVKSSPWENLKTFDQLQAYMAYFISRGKTIISPVSGPLYFKGLVYQYRGYHQDFIAFWQQLRQRKDYLELYLQGDRYRFKDFLDGSFFIGECARCNLPIPIPVASAYDIPHCDLCNSSNHIDDEYLVRVIAIAQPLTELLQLQKLCTVNRVFLSCISTPEALTPKLWENPLDLILIHSQIPSDLAKKWAKKIRQIPALVKVPIVALSKQAGNGVSSANYEQELANYLLNPLNGKHLAEYLRELSKYKQELNWFPA
ncbi:MAG: diguanylate cyclase [Gloeocapsa sp. DLM2.Bin57]|nr:MAG: diguanylate cyclase [Gloeocapsa sp. DLM2.Bin57]